MKFCAPAILVPLIQICVSASINSFKQFVVDVVTKNFARLDSKANLIYSIEDQLNADLKDSVIEDVFRESNIMLAIESVENLQTKASRKSSSIIFVDTFVSFLKVFNKITSTIFDLRGRYAIVLTNGKVKETNEIFQRLWRKQIYDVVVLFDDGFKVRALTFFPFNSEICDDTTAVELVVTNVTDLFANKLSDLKNCPIKVSGARTKPFIMMKKNVVVGRDIDVLEAIAKSLNFKMDLRYLDYQFPSGMLFDNGSSTGAINDLLQSKTDIIAADYFLNHGRLIYLEASLTYYNSEIVFIVPPGRDRKSIEKLVQPFSKNFWILLAAFFLVTFIIIFIVKPEHRSGMFLSRSPYMTLISIAFGVSLSSFPRKSSSRLLLMSFVMFCLVLQAVYQGSLFKFIQTNSKLKEVQSIAEMFDQDFQFYSTGTTDDLFTAHKGISQR